MKKNIFRFGKVIPACINGKNHKWKQSSEKFGETGICVKCGYDCFDNCYKKLEEKNDRNK